MKRKIGLWLVLTLTMVTVLGACGGSDGGNRESGGKTRVRFASWDNAEDLDSQQALVDKFNDSQEEIEVTLEAYGDDYDTKISAGMGSSDAPDVMYMWNYPAYYEALEPLDSYIDGEGTEYKNNFYEALWAYNEIDGSIYGIPVGFTTHALFYNKDIFTEAGVAEPTDDWTWDDLAAAAKAISEKVDGVTGFSYQLQADPYDFEMYLWSNNTAYIDKAGSAEGNLNSAEAVEAFSVFQNLQKEGAAITTEGGGTDEFRSGKTAMYIYGAWSVSTLDSDGLNYGIADLPAFDDSGKEAVSILSSSGLAMSKDSKNKEAAWEFIKYWTGEEMNKERIGYELSALKSVVESEGVMEDEKSAPFYSMLEKSSGYTPASFLLDDWGGLSEDLELALERINNPTTLEDPQAVLDEVAAAH